jgi:hypothetical protein
VEVSTEQLQELINSSVKSALAQQREMAGHAAAAIHPPHPTGTGAYDAENNPKTRKVKVIVAPRGIPGSSETFPGIGCAHRFWINGETEAQVTERQFADLKAHGGGLQVVDIGALEEKAKAELEAAVAAELEKRTAPAEPVKGDKSVKGDGSKEPAKEPVKGDKSGK